MQARLCLVILLALLAGAVTGAENKIPSQKAVRSRSVLAGDVRLDRRVSLATGRIFLGQLLDQISAETGTRLETDDRLGPISGYELTVVVHDRPARELLDSLPSLYNHPPDRWYWTKESGSKARYVLRHIQPPALLLQARQAFEEEFRQSQFRRTREFFSRTPEERALLARSDPYLQALQNPRSNSEGFFSFISGLTEAQIRDVGLGQRLEVAVGRLSTGQASFIRDLYQRANILGQPGTPQPEDLSGVALFQQGGTIFVDLGRSGGHGVLGGIWLEQAVREKDAREWLGLGESTTAPKQAVPAPGVEVRPEELQIRNDPLDQIILRLGRHGRLNVLLDRSLYSGSSAFTAEGSGLRGESPDILASLQYQNLQWKRRSSFLLFCPQNWALIPREVAVPWRIVRSLRNSAAKNDGYLQPQDWLQIAALRSEQIEYLSEEFPDANAIQRFRILLRLTAEMPERELAALKRPEGVGWADFSQETRNRLLVLFPSAEAQAVRAFLQWKPDATPPAVRLYLKPGGLPLRPVDISFLPRKAPKEEEEAAEGKQREDWTNPPSAPR